MHLKEKRIIGRAPKHFESEVLKEMRQLQKDMIFVKKTLIAMKCDCFYPPEEKLSKKFIKEAKEADKRIKAGMGNVYTPEQFKAKFL